MFRTSAHHLASYLCKTKESVTFKIFNEVTALWFPEQYLSSSLSIVTAGRNLPSLGTSQTPCVMVDTGHLFRNVGAESIKERPTISNWPCPQ